MQKRINPISVAPKRAGKSGKPGGNPARAGVKPAKIADWIGGARLRTLPLAISPVVLGTASALLISPHGWHWVRALLALAVALGLQIGVNFANDYSDGIRGTDRYRVGPSRLTGSGAAKPLTVRNVAFVFFGLAALAGLALSITSGQIWLILVGAVCIAAAYFYTGGKRPYGYYGLGEVVVFVFFGLVATAGTTFTQVGTVNVESWVAGAAAGFFACAVLMVNNIRDLDQDRVAGKRTFAVLIGGMASRIVFTIFVALPYVGLAFFSVFYPGAPYVFFTLIAAIPAVVIALTGKSAAEFVLVLKLTSLTALVFAIGLAMAIAL